jgi:hypothetical protein
MCDSSFRTRDRKPQNKCLEIAPGVISVGYGYLPCNHDPESYLFCKESLLQSGFYVKIISGYSGKSLEGLQQF